MISEPDHQLIARDPALPGLALLLDHERLLECLRKVWPAQPLDSVECSYLRYKPGVNCLAGYTAQSAAGSVRFYAKARTAEQHSRVPADDASCLLDEAGVVLRRFPDDRELRGLPRIILPESRARLLRKIVPGEPALWSARPEMLRYKPERRFVARLQGAEGARAFVKFYDKCDFENARRGAVAFSSRELLRVARPLGRSRRYRGIISEWLSGRPLDEWLRLPDLDPGRMRKVGVALAELHRQTPDGLVRPGREDNALSVLVAANAAAWLHPRQAERLREIARRIVAQLQAAPAADTAIHGDFNAEQLLWDTEGIGIIDYDQACLGDPAADFGSFVARLEYEELAGLVPAGRSDTILTAMLDGYCDRTRRVRPARIELQVAASLVRLTPHPFRDRERDWPEWIEGLLDLAERALRAHDRHRPGGAPASGRGRVAS